jgi:transcriptional regulator with XRE-family HTH domain
MTEHAFRHGVAIAIRGLRAERRWTQRELCRQTGLSPAYLSELEAGIKDASADVLERLADAFSYSIEEFMWVVLLAIMTGEVPNTARRDAAMKLVRHTLHSDPNTRAELEDFIRFQNWKRSQRQHGSNREHRTEDVRDNAEPVEPDFTED